MGASAIRTTIRVATAVLGASLMASAFAQSAPTALHPGDPGYAPLLEAATAPLRDALGDRVTLEVERLDTLGRWAFVLGNMRSPGGARPDFSETRFAARAASGGMSDVYVALLQRAPAADDDDFGTEPAADDGSADAPTAAAAGWRVVDHAIGPGDVAWLTWPEDHAAPRALFGF